MKTAREFIKGVALGAVAVSVCFGAAQINAADADTELSAEYQMYCEKAGQAYNICPELLEAIIETESGGNPDAVGEAGEIGLMQIYPKYHRVRAEHLGVYCLFAPYGNILVGTDYLSELFREHEDVGTVLMIYNGTENAEELGQCGEYTAYAEKILRRTEELERLHGK